MVLFWRMVQFASERLPQGEVELDEIHDGHYSYTTEVANAKGKKEDHHFVSYKGQCVELEESRKLTNMDSSWIDFSITKNVFTMLWLLL